MEFYGESELVTRQYKILQFNFTGIIEVDDQLNYPSFVMINRS
jgi:hypothetical protein